MPVYRVYLDTSVIGGCLDPEFSEDSSRVLKAVQAGKLIAIVGETVLAELQSAPKQVRHLLNSLPLQMVEVVRITPEVAELAEAYIEAGILPAGSLGDATHVAAATVYRADAILSWNFHHIVRLDRIIAYNRLNEARGYPALTIVTPVEVATDEDEPEDI